MASPLAMALAAPLPAQSLPTPTVGPTDVSGIFRDSYNAQMEKYKSDLAQKNAMWGGLASLAGTLGGAVLGGPMGAKIGGSIGSAIGGGAGSGGGFGGKASF